MARLEPTNNSYLRKLVRDELESVSPRFGIITGVHPHMSTGETANYKVDVRVVDDSGDGETNNAVEHRHVPVTASMSGAARGLQPDDLVVIHYRRADTSLPVVTDILYDDTDGRNAPLVDEGDFRLQIGDEAVIEIVTKDDGTQQINIGRQPDDREEIDAGLCINMDDGSICLTDGSDKGLFADGDGNLIQDWESFASPWGAAGPVSWSDSSTAGDGSNDGTDSETEMAMADVGALDRDVSVSTSSTSAATSLAVETLAATDVGPSSVVLNGELTELEGAPAATVSFEWIASDGSFPNTTSGQTLTAAGGFDAELSGLESDTQYEFRAVAEADGVDETGDSMSVTTGPDGG